MNSPSTSNVFANGLLSAFGNVQSLYTVHILKNVNHQDFLLLTPVPEPKGYAMLLAGLGVIGFVWRRRINSAG